MLCTTMHCCTAARSTLNCLLWRTARPWPASNLWLVRATSHGFSCQQLFIRLVSSHSSRLFRKEVWEVLSALLLCNLPLCSIEDIKRWRHIDRYRFSSKFMLFLVCKTWLVSGLFWFGAAVNLTVSFSGRCVPREPPVPALVSRVVAVYCVWQPRSSPRGGGAFMFFFWAFTFRPGTQTC
jgi:hypothetical protein